MNKEYIDIFDFLSFLRRYFWKLLLGGVVVGGFFTFIAPDTLFSSKIIEFDFDLEGVESGGDFKNEIQFILANLNSEFRIEKISSHKDKIFIKANIPKYIDLDPENVKENFQKELAKVKKDLYDLNQSSRNLILRVFEKIVEWSKTGGVNNHIDVFSETREIEDYAEIALFINQINYTDSTINQQTFKDNIQVIFEIIDQLAVQNLRTSRYRDISPMNISLLYKATGLKVASSTIGLKAMMLRKYFIGFIFGLLVTSIIILGREYIKLGNSKN